MPSVLILSLLLWACGDKEGDDSAAPDGGASDGGAGDGGDGGGGDGGGGDGGTSIPDGLGAISGDCLVLDSELTSAEPSLFVNSLDLTDTSWDTSLLSAGGLEIWEDGNLGGSSLESEVFAYEVLYRCEGAVLRKTEGEISYEDAGGKKTDFLAELDGHSIGVSVTRAYVWKNDDAYTVEEATALLEDKLWDILLSSANVADKDAWRKQILAVLAYSPDYAVAIEAAWPALDPAVRADTILWVTVTEGDDAYIY